MSTIRIIQILNDVARYFHDPLELIKNGLTQCRDCNKKANFCCDKCSRFFCDDHLENTDCTRLTKLGK